MRFSRSGFTFVEMLIVVIILGMVAAFVAPKIDLTRFQVESSMQWIGLTLLAVERPAITQQHNIIVQFDQTKQSLRIHEDRNNDGLVGAGERVRAVSLGEAVVFGRGGATAMFIGPGPITFTKTVGGLPAVIFRRDGSASEAAGIYLTSTRAARYSGGYLQDSRAILLDRATGRASWYRYNNSNSTWVKGF